MRKSKRIILVIAGVMVICLSYVLVGIFVSTERPVTIMGGILGCLSTICVGVIALIQDWKIYELSRMDQHRADVILERCNVKDEPFSANNVSHRRCGTKETTGGRYYILSFYNYLDNPVIDIKAKSYTVDGKKNNYTEIEEIAPGEHGVSTLYKNAWIELSCWVPQNINSCGFEIVFSNLCGEVFSKKVVVSLKEGKCVFEQTYSTLP